MIKAKVDYSLRAHSVYIRNTVRYRLARFLVVFAALMYAGFTLLSLMMALTNNKIYVEYILFMTLFFIVFIASVLRLLLFNPEKHYQKYSERFTNVKYEVSISEQSVAIDLDSDNYRKKAVYDISQVTAAREFMGYFILSISDVDQFMFASTDITEGTADELRKFLKDKLGKKYTRKDKWI
jgi:hypothetical protein